MDLQLTVKRKCFEEIKAGRRREEYRLNTPYWGTVLDGKEFDRIVITLSRSKGGEDNRIILPWRGYRRRTIASAEWGNEPREVFAIRLVGVAK